MTTITKAAAPRKSPCEGCRTLTEVTQLFYIRDKRLCEACGKQEVERWNQMVQESEGGPAITT
jgi:rRNA maturation endonuclease Nob1